MNGAQRSRNVECGSVERVRAGVILETVADAIAVGIPQQRIRVSDIDLATVAQPIAVGVGIERIGAEQILLQVRQPVVIGIFLRVDRIVRVQAVSNFIVIGNAVAVGVDAGRRDSHRRHP